MAFLGERIEDQVAATSFSPRCTKDLIEETLFLHNRHLFTGLDLVFFDTTSIYFEGSGGEDLGERGFSKDHRPDLRQMILGVVLDDNGMPLCCEIWPGNTADAETLTNRENPGSKVPYIPGTRMRTVKEIKEEVLSRAGRYREVHPEGKSSKDPSPLKVKEVWVGDSRYIVCVNSRQARKEAAGSGGDHRILERTTQEGTQEPGWKQGLPEVTSRWSGKVFPSI
jgi:hypothetical protein